MVFVIKRSTATILRETFTIEGIDIKFKHVRNRTDEASWDRFHLGDLDDFAEP